MNKKILADESPRFDGIFLVFTVDRLLHSFEEQPVLVLGEERIPVASPNDLDYVPARAAVDRLEFLDDLSVPTYGTVEALQIAVNNMNEIV